MRKYLLIFLLFLTYSGLSAQNLTVVQYIEAYKDIAIKEMKRVGVPASITLAQGILETESGTSDLVRRSNNHFGIKCKSNWSGESVSHDDDEHGECFRKYNSAEDSYKDHSNFLRGSERYSSLFKLSPKDYKGWAFGLKRAGYATNPAYPKILIKSIEDYNLQQYTLMGLDEVPVSESSENEKNPEAAILPGEIVTLDSAVATADLSGKTKFNGIKASYALNGTSLLAIATSHHIDLVKLLEYNDMKEDGLLTDDTWIYLERKPVHGNRDFYITQKKETAFEIAQLNGIQLSSLLKYNDLKGDEKINAGTKVYLRPVSDLKNDIQPVQIIKMHEVQAKEGLYAISKKYNVTIQDLKTWNNLISDDLKVGQKLIISK